MSESVVSQELAVAEPATEKAVRGAAAQVGDDRVGVNEVRLVGRVSQAAEERTLPSGDRVWSFRVVVPRPPETRRGRRATVDALECALWGGRPKRTVLSWRVGDEVEVIGCLRRRFFRTPAGARSLVEVEVSSARVIRRAASA